MLFSAILLATHESAEDQLGESSGGPEDRRTAGHFAIDVDSVACKTLTSDCNHIPRQICQCQRGPCQQSPPAPLVCILRKSAILWLSTRSKESADSPCIPCIHGMQVKPFDQRSKEERCVNSVNKDKRRINKHMGLVDIADGIAVDMDISRQISVRRSQRAAHTISGVG